MLPRYARESGYFDRYDGGYGHQFQEQHAHKLGGSYGGYSGSNQVIYDDTSFSQPGEDATGKDYKPISDCEGDAVQIKKCSNKPCREYFIFVRYTSLKNAI